MRVMRAQRPTIVQWGLLLRQFCHLEATMSRMKKPPVKAGDQNFLALSANSLCGTTLSEAKVVDVLFASHIHHALRFAQSVPHGTTTFRQSLAILPRLSDQRLSCPLPSLPAFRSNLWTLNADEGLSAGRQADFRMSTNYVSYLWSSLSLALGDCASSYVHD